MVLMLAHEIDQQMVRESLMDASFWTDSRRPFPPVVLLAKEWLEERYPCDDAVWTVAQKENYSIDVSLSVIPGTGKENDEFNR